MLLRPVMEPVLQPVLQRPYLSFGGWSPRTLFAAGEQGGWWDPSDLSTMFQDSAGTTAAAVGQPVGLVLDKRLGLVRGAEQVTNGDFVSGLAGWTNTSNHWTWADGRATMPSTSSFLPLEQTLTLTTDVRYEVTFNVVAVTDTVNCFVRNPGTSSTTVLAITSTGEKRVTFVANSTERSFGFARNASAAAITIDNISIRPLPGNHLSQSTAASRPTLQSGYAGFDGTDDSWATGSIDFSGADKVTVIAGVYKASDAATGVVCELSSDYPLNNGVFALNAPAGANPNFQFRSKGTTTADNSVSGNAAPTTKVLTGQGDIAGDLNILRINGVEGARVTTDQGSGSYSNAALYIGRRGGSSLPFNGRLYGLIVVGRALTATEIASAERWMANRAGVTL